MVMSMTGYGIHSVEYNGTNITIEMRSVNNRYLDIITKIPRSFSHLETELKKAIQTYFKRGRIEVYITISGNSLSNKKLQLDWQLLDQYVENMQKAKEKYGLQDAISIESLTMIDDVFLINDVEMDTSMIDEQILQYISTVCEKLKAHRISEGEFLMKDIKHRVKKIKKLLDEVQSNQVNVQTHYRNRIMERITDYTKDLVEIDPSVLIKDIAILAEKGDITEEVTRLYSHVEHFYTVIEKDEEMGRKLDFITQEMHREVNTIGAKSVDPQLSNTVVTLKSEIEKIKEQIQNIE